MHDPYYPMEGIDGDLYYPAPYSLASLSPQLHTGLVAIGFFALMSVLSCTLLISFILWRIWSWREHYRTFIGSNQYVVLVLNLLFADLQQAAGFLISFYWRGTGNIVAPHPACYAQGWLIHSGDVSSGLFVLAIAVHTAYTAVYGRRVSGRPFMGIVLGLWVFAYLLTSIGAGIHGEEYFVRAGAWCWVSSAFEDDRLALHYIWVFIIEFSTVIIYVFTFIKLRLKTRSIFEAAVVRGDWKEAPNMKTIEAVNRITLLMVLYPCVYVVLTLPLSSGRMWSMAHSGEPNGDTFSCIAGALLSSCGWVDCLLYTATRKRLLSDTMPHSPSDISGDWEATEMGSKGITHTRTVTVENGTLVDTFRDEDCAMQIAHPSQQPVYNPFNQQGGRSAVLASLTRSFDGRDTNSSDSIKPILLDGASGFTGRNKTEITTGGRARADGTRETFEEAEEGEGSSVGTARSSMKKKYFAIEGSPTLPPHAR